MLRQIFNWRRYKRVGATEPQDRNSQKVTYLIFIQPLMAMDGGLNAEVEIFSRLLMLMLLQSMLGMVNWPCLMVLVVNQF